MFLNLITKLFKHDSYSLKFNTIRSAFWSIVGKGSNNFIRILGNLILTRILYPEAFGLMAIANVFIMMIYLFADTGVSVSIIQNPRGAEKEYLNTAWVISIFRGLFLLLLISALAYPASLFYKEPLLKYILLIMAFGPFIDGFLNPAFPLFVKKFQVKKQVIMEVSTQIVGLIVTIILTLSIGSVYGLAIGFVTSTILKVLASYIVIEYKPSFIWNKIAGHDFLHFGKYIIINTLITVLVNQMGVLMIGKLLSMESVSFYNIGYNLGGLLASFCVQMLSQSYMAAISSVQTDIKRIQRIYQKTITLLITVTVPFSMVIALFSHDIIRLLYDPRYHLAYISMYWIGLSGIIRTISAVTGVTFFGLGRPVLETISYFGGLILLIILLPFSIRHSGLNGGAACVASVFIFVTIIECILLKFKLNFPLKVILKAWLQSIIIALFCYIFYYLVNPYLHNDKLYNIPFAIISGIIFMLISILGYRISEGKYPLSINNVLNIK